MKCVHFTAESFWTTLKVKHAQAFLSKLKTSEKTLRRIEHARSDLETTPNLAESQVAISFEVSDDSDEKKVQVLRPLQSKLAGSSYL